MKSPKAEMLSQLLDHGNHHRVRIQGFQLLLLWINDQTIELTECMHLYANTISLDLFLHDQIRIGNDDYQGKDNMWRRSSRPISLGQKSIKGKSNSRESFHYIIFVYSIK